MVLPNTPDIIYQPNKVTNGRYEGFSGMQWRILCCLVSRLQRAIELEMQGKKVDAGDFFRECTEKEGLEVIIPLGSITTRKNYPEIKHAAEKLRIIGVNFPVTRNGEKYRRYTGLINEYDIPEREKGQKLFLHLYLRKEVAQILISIEKKLNGSPMQFTSFQFTVAMSFKNKYSYKLYWLISSWKSKGGFFITLANLKLDLGLFNNEYPNYADFKKRVLLPVQKELKEKADCWFNHSERDFEVWSGNKITGLNFKIIEHKNSDKTNQMWDYVKSMLRLHCGFGEKHIRSLRPIFNENNKYEEVMVKINELTNYVSNPDKPIKNKQAYMASALLSGFIHSEG